MGRLVFAFFVFFDCFLVAFPSLAGLAGLSLDLWDAIDSSSFSKSLLKARAKATLD